jgi:hypothetical protein
MNEDRDNINCTEEETTRRLSFCMPCEHNVLDIIPKCNQCNCPLSSLASMNFKSCPIGKW